jgi:DNA-binding GntR family transcriptional regulator
MVSHSKSSKTSRRGEGRPRAARAHANKPIRQSLVERAYTEIRRRIVDNEYLPAQQVLEQDLASELGVSRTPVREALVRLEHEQFVQIIPRHGMRVVPLSLDDLRDMYEVLTALEVTAVERLARSKPDGRALAALDRAINDMDAAVERRDADARVRADERFHRMLIDLCGNARLASMAYMMWDQGHRARMTTVGLRRDLKQSNDEHRAVVDAIRHGRWQEATTYHRRHRERVTIQIIALLEECRLAR